MNYNAGVYSPNTNPIGGFNNNFNNPNPMQFMPPQMQQNGQMPMQQANAQMPQPQPRQAQPQPQMTIPPQTNKILVPSWEAARDGAPLNSEMVTFHQDGKFGFEVIVDPQGRREVNPFRCIPCTTEEVDKELKGVKGSDLEAFATKQDLENLESKIAQYIKQNMPAKLKTKVEKENDVDIIDDLGDK